MIAYVVLGVLGLTCLVALVALWRYPRLWLLTLGVLATAASIVLYVPVRMAFHTPSGFDPVGDGFGIFAEFLAFAFIAGLVHVALFFVLIGTMVEAVQRRPPDGDQPKG